VPRSREPRTVQAGDATRFIVDVSAEVTLRGDRTVTLLVRYRKNGRPGRAGAPLKVTPPAPVNPATVAALTVEGTFASMQSGDPTTAYIRVKNATAADLEVGPVAVTSSGFIEPVKSGRTKLPANGTAVLDATLSVKDEVSPGKHTMIFDVPVHDGKELVTTLSAVKEADVSIEGESELLTAFGVPTLLLLPGALFLGFAALLWNQQVLRHPADKPAGKIDIASVAFIAASIIASFVILSLSALWWTDFFEAYSRGKIFILALVSAVAGTVLYLACMGARNRFQAWRTPNLGDCETTVIQKLGRQGMGVRVPKYQQNGKTGYRIQPLRDGRPETWFAPRIRVEWISNDEAVHQSVAAARANDDAKQMAKVLKQAVQARTVTVDFVAAAGSNTRPYPVTAAEMGTETGPEPIVYWGS
jgi:hypothetical protein